jgi:hypothetical protein
VLSGYGKANKENGSLAGGGGVDWIRLVQDRNLWRTHGHGDEPSGSGATELAILFLRCFIGCRDKMFQMLSLSLKWFINVTSI